MKYMVLSYVVGFISGLMYEWLACEETRHQQVLQRNKERKK